MSVTLALILLTLSACDIGKKPTEQSIVPIEAETIDPVRNHAFAEDGSAIFMGYDGSNDFSAFFPNLRSLAIADSTLARVETIEVTLSDATIAALIAEAKAASPNVNEAMIRASFSDKQKVILVTPLRAGSTQVQFTASADRWANVGGSQGAGVNDVWQKSMTGNLKIYAYSPEQTAAGKHRYDFGAGGALQACQGCHESRGQGAPPHELGRVLDISDESALEWIKTGKTANRSAKIAHAWQFTSELEERGTLAYLRSKAGKNIEALTKLYFEQAIADGKFIVAGLKPPVGEGPATGGETTASASTGASGSSTAGSSAATTGGGSSSASGTGQFDSILPIGDL